MGIIPQFYDAVLVLLSVTSQNSTPKCFSLHATINWFYPNSMMPGMRAEVMGPAILCTQRTLLLKGPERQVTYYHRVKTVCLSSGNMWESGHNSTERERAMMMEVSAPKDI